MSDEQVDEVVSDIQTQSSNLATFTAMWSDGDCSSKDYAMMLKIIAERLTEAAEAIATLED